MANEIGHIVEFAAKLPAELQKAQVRGVQKAALTVTRGIRDEIRSATGGDSRLSGVGRRGARVGARYDVKGFRNPTAIIMATGPLHLIEHDTSPHEIKPYKRRRVKKKALKYSDGRIRGGSFHPGTTAKRPFAKGVEKTRDAGTKAFKKEIDMAVKRAL